MYIYGENMKACVGMIKSEVRKAAASKYGKKMELRKGTEYVADLDLMCVCVCVVHVCMSPSLNRSEVLKSRTPLICYTILCLPSSLYLIDQEISNVW